MSIGYSAVNIAETLLRMIPFKCKTGLVKIGNPDRNSPVFLTCNYHLTVERVKRALQGMDCYLLVANSKGVNVWCAATGGLLTSHDVVSVLKTSRIEDAVDHRTVILPQLAAAGIEAHIVQKKTGWHIVWGPVYAKDIPEFTKTMEKTPKMRKVTFSVQQRIEMSAAWAFPVSVFFGLVLFFFWQHAFLPAVVLVWVLSFVMYVSFPVYGPWLKKKVLLTDFGNGGIQVTVWVVFMGVFSYYSTVAGIPQKDLIKWGITSLMIVLILGVDLRGMTPVYKSGLHRERLVIVLDDNKCKGAGLCERVCPRLCFHVDRPTHTATLQKDPCIQCGACVVQCPFDALSFESPTGEVIPPETIRKYKLNLMGSRCVKVA